MQVLWFIGAFAWPETCRLLLWAWGQFWGALPLGVAPGALLARLKLCVADLPR